MFKQVLKERGGNFAIMGALTLPVLLGAAGLAVDYTQLQRAKTQMQNSIDAAVLAASKKTLTTEQRRQVFQSMLEQSANAQFYSVTDTDLVVDEGLNSIRITGSADVAVDLYFMEQLNANHVEVVAAAMQSTQKVELGLVLDNTGSMGQAGIDALKNASSGLLDVVESSYDGAENVRVALVPFVTAVNINGEGFDPAWIDEDGEALYNGWAFLEEQERQARKKAHEDGDYRDDDEDEEKDLACKNIGEGTPAIEKREACEDSVEAATHGMQLFEASSTAWKGCVEARPYPYILSLAEPDPANPDTLFVPYFAPDEPGDATFSGGNDGNSFNNSWLNDLVTGNDKDVQRSTAKYIAPATKKVEEEESLSRGPNRACPTPIVPLTSDFAKVRDGIEAMNFWNGSGTNISEGLAWGWRVLTPEAPYEEADAFDPERVSKFLVLMTDGRNVSFGNKNTINKSDYGSYGYLSEKRIPGASSSGQVESKLNGWTREMCTKMKEQGIEIFTVVYKEKDTGVQDLFRSCASEAGNFYMTDDTAGLETAFSDIGKSMSPLRLIR